MTNREKFAETYSQAFLDSYPSLDAEKSKTLIEYAVKVALENIRIVDIQRPAFKLTSKRLGIKNTFKDIEKFLKDE